MRYGFVIDSPFEPKAEPKILREMA